MIALIRHAVTAGNLERRYIGRTDESILRGTRIDAEYPKVDIVVSSPMKRCIETAALIYPGKKPVIYEGLAETDFGSFENKSYEELKDDELYKRWLGSNGTMPFPGGESPEAFRVRCLKAYNKAAEDFRGKSTAFIVHGGTIMAVMSSIFGGGFYDYHVANLCGFMFEQENNESSETKGFVSIP